MFFSPSVDAVFFSLLDARHGPVEAWREGWARPYGSYFLAPLVAVFFAVNGPRVDAAEEDRVDALAGDEFPVVRKTAQDSIRALREKMAAGTARRGSAGG